MRKDYPIRAMSIAARGLPLAVPLLEEFAMDAVSQIPAPRNEPVLNYAPGSVERAEL
jgi:hypothetical protein